MVYLSILITGGAGYIGSHTAVLLAESGESIVLLDNFSNSGQDVHMRVEQLAGAAVPLYEADIRDLASLKNIIKKENIDTVIHFAGLKAVGESVEHPLMYYQNNVLGVLVLLEACLWGKVSKFVFSSSATVYSSAAAPPYQEDMPRGATNPYAHTKLIIENILADFAQKLDITILRYFNPVGAHPSGLLGENPRGVPNNLMPYISQVAAGRLPKLKVFGGDYPTPDGSCIRDYIHIQDLAHGHILALKHQSNNGTAISTYNLGTGRGSSVLEIIAAFEEATGVKIPYQITGRRAGDVPISFASISKAQKEIGFKAALTLHNMCADTWRWQSSQCKL